LICSDFDIKLEADGELFGLGTGDEAGSVEAGGEGDVDGVVVSVLEESVDLAIVADLDLGGGVSVEAVGEAKVALHGLGIQVEDEIAAESLVIVGGVAEEDGQLVQGQGGRLVLETDLGLAGGVPVNAEVTLAQLVGLHVEGEVSTNGNLAGSEVASGKITDLGCGVNQDLSLNIVGVILSTELELSSL
jgi:hypothetical protein